MSETAAALLIVPYLASLVLLLEGLRIGCTRIARARQNRPECPTEVLPEYLSGTGDTLSHTIG